MSEFDVFLFSFLSAFFLWLGFWGGDVVDVIVLSLSFLGCVEITIFCFVLSWWCAVVFGVCSCAVGLWWGWGVSRPYPLLAVPDGGDGDVQHAFDVSFIKRLNKLVMGSEL